MLKFKLELEPECRLRLRNPDDEIAVLLSALPYTLDMDAISAMAAASGVFLAGLERDQSTEAAASCPEKGAH